MITKDQIRPPSSKRATSGNRSIQESRTSERRSCRANPQPPKGNDVINLERLNTEEFHNLIGEGADIGTIEERTSLSNEKKKENESRLNTLLQKSEQSLKQSNIYMEAEKSLNDTPAGNSKQICSVPSVENYGDELSTSNQLQISTHTTTDKTDESVASEVSKNVSGTSISSAKTKEIAIETEPTTVFCGCPRCTNVLQRFYALIRDSRSQPCTGSLVGGLQAFQHGEAWPQTSISLNATGASINPENNTAMGAAPSEEMVPLLLGCKVMLPVIKKNNLRHKITTGDPQAYVNELMDIFFKPAEMARMTAEGRTPGSIKMDQDIKDAIMAYITCKYDKRVYNFDKTLFTQYINSKCYCERRKIWNKDGAEPAIPIKKLPKKVKKPPQAENNSLDCDSEKKKPKKTNGIRVDKYKRPQNSTPTKSSAHGPPGASSTPHRSVKRATPATPTAYRSPKKHRFMTGGKRPRLAMNEFIQTPMKSSENVRNSSFSPHRDELAALSGSHRKLKESRTDKNHKNSHKDTDDELEEFLLGAPSKYSREKYFQESKTACKVDRQARNTKHLNYNRKRPSDFLDSDSTEIIENNSD